MFLKSYTISTDLSGGYIADQLNEEIVNSSSIINFSHFIINEAEDLFEIYGDSMDETSLDSVISSHIPDYTKIYVQKTVQENKVFADNMMQRMKEKNLLEGLSTIDQAAWVHHRLRKVDYNLDAGLVVQIDVLNLVVSGDIETAESVLGQMSPDDMTEPYHWWTQARIDWVRNEVRSYLGWPLI